MAKVTLLFCLTLAVVNHASAQDDVPSSERKKAIEAMKAFAKEYGEMSELEKTLSKQVKDAKPGQIDQKVVKKLSEVRENLKQAPKDAISCSPTLRLGTVGEFGRLPHENIRIGKVIDKSSVIITTRNLPDDPRDTEKIQILVTGNWN